MRRVTNVFHDASEIRNQMQGIKTPGRNNQGMEPDSEKGLIPAEKPGFLFRRLEGPAWDRGIFSLLQGSFPGQSRETVPGGGQVLTLSRCRESHLTNGE